MYTSLEVRVPFLDHELVDLVTNLNEKDRFYPLGKKQLLKTIALSDMPSTLYERPKSGFELPIDTWIRQSLRTEIDQIFHDEELVKSVGLCPQEILKLWNAFENGQSGIYWSRIWSLYVLLNWVDRHKVSLN
jgi:asparagine synthase (glutamine-hydrolysing)